MRSDLTKPIIFISYAHADEQVKSRVQWLSFVMNYLRPAVKHGDFEVWTDREMEGGADWEEKIEQNLRACHIFVLLVSPNSMSSNYIIDKEILIARERKAAGDDLHVYPLLLEPTPDAGLDQVRDFNLRPRDARPFSSFPLNIRKQHMTDTANEIGEIAARIAARKVSAGANVKAASTSRASLPAFLHITGLPETFYERLVGRDAELRRLDEAWSNEKTSILSLVAEGGAGKSALVNEWLTRLQADSYRGADCVLGWSFYSQGSKERATAADEFLNWALDKLGVKVETTSASAKGEAIAEALIKQRALLVLDGVEPLQHGPGPQKGQLKDQGLRALLRRFAAAPPRAGHGMIVLTSRLAVVDIQRFEQNAAPVVDVERLSDEAGAELLRDNDVWGVDRDLKAASRDFGGHPLALTLLASLIKETQNGDVRRRDHIRGLLADPNDPHHGDAGRVMESYEREWLADQPILLAICNSSASSTARRAATASGRCAPSLLFPGLLMRSLTSATTIGCAPSCDCAKCGCSRRATLPMLMRSTPIPWCANGSAIGYGELTKRRGKPPTAGSTTICATRRTKAKRRPSPTSPRSITPSRTAAARGDTKRRSNKFTGPYLPSAAKQNNRVLCGQPLGAFGSDLAAMSWFFDRPYETPAAALTPVDHSWVLGNASSWLRAQGRLREALPPARATLQGGSGEFLE